MSSNLVSREDVKKRELGRKKRIKKRGRFFFSFSSILREKTNVCLIYFHLSLSSSFFPFASSLLALLRAVGVEVGDQRVGVGLGDSPELDSSGDAALDLSLIFFCLKSFFFKR